VTIVMQVRAKSRVIAGAFLIVFCWLGWLAFKCAPIFAGLEDRLPVMTRLAFAYGPVACPLFGVLAAGSLILSDMFFRRHWLQWVLIALFAVLIVCIFRTFLFSGVFMGPAHETNSRSNRFPLQSSKSILGGVMSASVPVERRWLCASAPILSSF
jgi:hypothetical protein